MKRIPSLATLAGIIALGVMIAHVTPAFAETDQTQLPQTSQQTQQARLAAIITKGDQEIERRLAALSKISAFIDKAVKLSESDKKVLSNEVSAVIDGLTALKTKLDAETTLAAAREDAKTILTQYRVYALIMPKIHLVKVADGQIVIETKLSEIASKLAERLSDLSAAGKDVASLEATLEAMLAKVATAQAISTSVQSKVITLQPSDYNNDRTILAGHNTQLKTARQSLIDARADAKSIVAGIKALTEKSTSTDADAVL